MYIFIYLFVSFIRMKHFHKIFSKKYILTKKKFIEKTMQIYGTCDFNNVQFFFQYNSYSIQPNNMRFLHGVHIDKIQNSYKFKFISTIILLNIEL